jgi:Domain of unknown function (DUF222)
VIATNPHVYRPGTTRPARSKPHGTRPASSKLASTGPVGTGPASTGPASTEEAIAAVTAGLRYLARVDAPSLGVAGQARCLRALEAAEAVHTAARVNVLAAFSGGAGYADDGCGSVRSWLVWQTRVTRGAAAGSYGWLRRLRGHRPVGEALAAGTISVSWARKICEWTDRLPEQTREDADAILLAAAAGGASLGDLAALAQEMYLRSGPADPAEDRFEDRALFLGRTLDGAGRLEADLTPAASAALRTVLDSLGAKAGPEDVRSQPQRDHDALEEACVRLIASGMLPQRAGQPVHLQVQVTLEQLWALAGGAAGPGLRPDWAGRARGSGLTSAEVQALGCDATILPVVTGQVDNAALDALVQLFLTAAGHAAPPSGDPAGPADPAEPAGLTEPTGPTGPAETTQPAATARGAAGPAGGPPDAPSAGPAASPTGAPSAGPAAGLPGLPEGLRSPQALRQLLLQLAVGALSGPGGLAAALRAGPGQPFPTVSLPLDVGAASEVIPGYLRRLIILRDRHCRFPGCRRKPSVCQVHHLIHREDGGVTSLANCALMCRFHHLIAIHRWGWKLRASPDGSITAFGPDGRILRDHAPPQLAA